MNIREDEACPAEGGGGAYVGAADGVLGHNVPVEVDRHHLQRPHDRIGRGWVVVLEAGGHTCRPCSHLDHWEVILRQVELQRIPVDLQQRRSVGVFLRYRCTYCKTEILVVWPRVPGQMAGSAVLGGHACAGLPQVAMVALVST